ncbi:glycosyltransferase [Pedobacter sp. GR22-6]|uniref:glycosyltransferase n=1 Tax=Pedobacter sp. GR22-6 TaxID=3127957 RepID=UPI00307D891C
MINILVHFLKFIVALNLLLPVTLYIFWRFSGRTQKTVSFNVEERDYAIIVTAYEQTVFIPEVVRSLLDMDYHNFMVYIVADNCIADENLIFDDPRVIVLYPPNVLASNIRSHFFAIDNFSRDHEVLLIMDSDNLAHPTLLKELNDQFNQGFHAVQGIREAKNLDTTLAALDAARDIYYHFYDGQLLFDLGSSATLSGSGMAFDVALYRECLEKSTMSGAGFDKVLQAQILGRNQRIAFSKEAIVYDQKTASSGQLVNQRSRWISTWFRFFKYGFSLIFKGISNFSINQLLFGIILLRPPLFMFLLLGVVLVVLNLFINPFFSLVLCFCFAMFVLGFIIALKSHKTDERIYKALRFIPVFIFYQLISLMKSLLPNKKNIATKHNK